MEPGVQTYEEEFSNLENSIQIEVIERAELIHQELLAMEAGSVFIGLLEKTELPKIMKSFLDVDPEITRMALFQPGACLKNPKK